METDKSKGKYSVTGGKTIIGRIFSYQEKTGMSTEQILRMPYIMFILGMLDAPAIDYEKKQEEVYKPNTVEEELKAFNKLFK